MTRADTPTEARVHDVINGKHGFFAVTVDESGKIEGSITVSLEEKDNVWLEARHPKRGEILLLEDITTKPAGWRAGQARFLRPTDR